MRLAPVTTVVVLSLALSGLIGCNSGNEPVATEQVNEQQEIGVEERQPRLESSEQYAVQGEVVAVDREKLSVTLDHEEIEGLMKAMEMEFQVESADVLEGVEQGDQVRGQLVKKDGRFLITDLTSSPE